MTRQSSIEAYNDIKNNGLLSKRRLEVYIALYENGPCTTNELLKKMTFLEKNNNPSVHVRLNELKHLTVVREIGTTICSITNRTVILWEVTNNLPIKLEKRIKIKCEHCNGTGYK